MGGLNAELVRHVPSPEGPQADVHLVEPNGEKHLVRCLVKPTGTDLGGDGEVLAYLNDRYGPEAVCATSRALVLREHGI